MQDRERESPGYLAGAEASQLAAQAGPGVIYIHLRREIATEQAQGQPSRRMFIELDLGQAVRHWQDLGELIRRAGALEQAR
jgi:hypothetical protein